jgi:acid stress chaperone HdeA
MKGPVLLTFCMLMSIAGWAGADTPAAKPAAASVPAKTIKPVEMTCEDFLSYDDVSRPQIVYFTEGLSRNGKPEDAVIDIDRVNRLVPMLVEDCKREPHASYWQRMKRRFGIS